MSWKSTMSCLEISGSKQGKNSYGKRRNSLKLREELTQQRRDLPWEAVGKSYEFDGSSGKLSLTDLFSGRSQLIVYHFMFDPSWDQGCKYCSFWADHYSGMIPPLNHRDVSFVCISRAPVEKLEAFKKRMGWTFPWYSSLHTDFNFDFQASLTEDEVEKRGVLQLQTSESDEY